MKKTLILFLGLFIWVGCAAQQFEQLPVVKGYSYEYTDWYDNNTVTELEAGNYDSFLSQFDFVHETIPTNKNKDWSWNGFFLGNGQVGMIVDYLGSQATPYFLLDYTSVWRSSLDSLCTVAKPDELNSEYWDVYNNTAPSISVNESWSKEETPSGQGNWYERGALGIRLAAFPLIGGKFDVNKISNYNQRLALSTNQCTTEFVYDNKVEVKIVSFTSWRDNRVLVYNVELTNVSDSNLEAGFVAEPIVAFQRQRYDFEPSETQLSLMIPKQEEGLYYDHYLSLGVQKKNKAVSPISKEKFKDVVTLKPGKSIDYSAYMSIYCGTESTLQLSSAQNNISTMLSKGFTKASFDHKEEVTAFWDKFYVLLPWRDLCKTYYRNVLISASNMRYGMYNAQVCMMTNSAYKGLSYGMDNMPAIELLLQLGRTDYIENFAKTLREALPSDHDNKGHTINYDYDQFPWRTSIFGNSPGNTMWMLYEYYRLTHDEEFLKETLYPMMRSISNFYTGYGEEINGVYGFWTRKNYQDREWIILSYDEKLFTESKRPYTWGEIDHPSDVVGPAKLTLQLTIDIANKLGVDEDLIDGWQDCHDRLMIPQNDNFYQHYIARPDGMGLGDDVFPFRNIMACAVYNLTYPTPVVTNDAKMEDTYRILRDTTQSKFEWFFNYNQQLWGAVARLRLGDEMEWLMTESDMRLGKTFHKDGMMICEHQLGGAAGYFFMPYGMIAASVNEMLLQSYDGVLKVFPAIFPGFNDYPVSFKGLHGLDGFVVSALRDNGKTDHIDITSKLGSQCNIEVPVEWSKVQIQENGKSKPITFNEELKNIRIDGEDVVVKVINFKTDKGKTYRIIEG